MQDGQYIRIHKEVETYVEYYYQFKTKTVSTSSTSRALPTAHAGWAFPTMQ